MFLFYYDKGLYSVCQASNTLMNKNVARSFLIKCCQSANCQAIIYCNFQHYTSEQYLSKVKTAREKAT